MAYHTQHNTNPSYDAIWVIAEALDLIDQQGITPLSRATGGQFFDVLPDLDFEGKLPYVLSFMHFWPGKCNLLLTIQG